MDSANIPMEKGESGEQKKAGAPQVVNIVRGGADTVQADTVNIEQGGVTSVTADHLTVRQGGVVKADVKQLEMLQGGVVLARTETAQLTASNTQVLIARADVKMDQSGARVLLARGQVTMNQSGAAVMFARDVQADKSGVTFLIAQKIEGDVIAMFGPRESLLFGAIAGLVGGLVVLVGGLMKKRKKTQ